MNLIDIIEPLWLYLDIEAIKAISLVNRKSSTLLKRDYRQKYLIKRDFDISYELESKYNFTTLYKKTKIAKYFITQTGAIYITDLAIDIINKFVKRAYWRHFKTCMLQNGLRNNLITAVTVCATMNQFSCYVCSCTRSFGTECCRNPGDPCAPHCNCGYKNNCKICADLKQCQEITYPCQEGEKYYAQYCKGKLEALIAINPYNFNEISIDSDDPEIPCWSEDYPEYRLSLFNQTYVNRVKMFRYMSTFSPQYIYFNHQIRQSDYDVDLMDRYCEKFFVYDGPGPDMVQHFNHLYDQMIQASLL